MGNKRGCPTCAGIDPKSCLRCAGKTKLSDWQATDNTAVIQALEKRIAELEAALSQSMGDHVDTGRALRLARAENQRLRDALEIISGKRQCVDNLMSNSEIANAALLGGGENG